MRRKALFRETVSREPAASDESRAEILYRNQREVRLISSDPPQATIADNDAPQRTIYFERKIAGPAEYGPAP